METGCDAPPCAICAAIGAYVEIANPQDSDPNDVGEDFPPEAAALQVPNEGLAEYYRYKNERLLKCPDCGAHYWYRTWAPGGSDDVMHTTIHHALRRLAPLETHVELDDARYQTRQRVMELGAAAGEAYAAIVAGAGSEMALLRASACEIVAGVLDALEHRYRRSDELAQMLDEFYPGHDHGDQIAEARARDARAARYYAGVLVEYLPACPPAAIPETMVRRTVILLGGDDAEIRQLLRDALLYLARDEEEGEHVRRVVLGAAPGVSAPSAELEALLAALR